MSTARRKAMSAHRTPTYGMLQQVCNRAYAMEKINRHFDINKLLNIDPTSDEYIEQSHKDAKV